MHLEQKKRAGVPEQRRENLTEPCSASQSAFFSGGGAKLPPMAHSDGINPIPARHGGVWCGLIYALLAFLRCCWGNTVWVWVCGCGWRAPFCSSDGKLERGGFFGIYVRLGKFLGEGGRAWWVS